MVNCTLYYVIEVFPVFDYLSPLSNTPSCVAVIKTSKNVGKNPLALSFQLGLNFWVFTVCIIEIVNKPAKSCVEVIKSDSLDVLVLSQKLFSFQISFLCPADERSPLQPNLYLTDQDSELVASLWVADYVAIKCVENLTFTSLCNSNTLKL